MTHQGDRVQHIPGIDQFANEALSIIEIAEARQLNWGFINGAQTEEDLVSLLADFLTDAAEDTANISAHAIIENLVARCLLLRQGNRDGTRYRSRFAETVRALFLLRQRFSDDDWNTGARLVGDLKLLLQHRRFPRRDQPASHLLARLTAAGTPERTCQALATLLGEGVDAPLHTAQFQLAEFQVDAVQQVLAALAQPQDHTGCGRRWHWFG